MDGTTQGFIKNIVSLISLQLAVHQACPIHSMPPDYAMMASTLLRQMAWPSSGPIPIAQQQPNCQGAIKAVRTEIRAQGGHSAVLAQVMANNCIHSDRLTKHSPWNSEKYAAVLKEFEK